MKTIVVFYQCKALGIDDTGPGVLKACAVALALNLCHLFNLSVSHATLPSDWLVHVAVSIHKSGDKGYVSNYSPITLLCMTSKVLERLVFNWLIEFAGPNISVHQLGFMPRRSTVKLLLFLHQIITSFSSKAQHEVIYWDIRKAFNTISHNKLLLKLAHMGVNGCDWTWI
uniref:Reverse transcriptase domain-containing protein n=1 Tax=Amphimedon queenslandica TaxID=400682 RepID=A0A1X7V3X7_AMPQE